MSKEKDPVKTRKVVEFDEGKLWFQKKSGTILIGLTQQGLDELSAVESVDLPSEGDDFDKDDVVVELDGETGNYSVTTPAAGFVVETNTALETDTALLNEDPTGEGWLVRLEIQDETDLTEFE